MLIKSTQIIGLKYFYALIVKFYKNYIQIFAFYFQIFSNIYNFELQLFLPLNNNIYNTLILLLLP